VAVNEQDKKQKRMNLINKYKIVALFVLPVLILLLFRSIGQDHFKSDAKKWAEPSFKHTNFVRSGEIGSLSGEKLIVCLDRQTGGNVEKAADVVYVTADSVISRRYLTMIRDHNGPVLLSSSDPALSARIWMIITQMGFRNIYILTYNPENEVFQNGIRSDTPEVQEL